MAGRSHFHNPSTVNGICKNSMYGRNLPQRVRVFSTIVAMMVSLMTSQRPAIEVWIAMKLKSILMTSQRKRSSYLLMFRLCDASYMMYAAVSLEPT